MGESKFEAFLGPYPVDVVNGFWYQTRNIWPPTEAQKQNDVVCLGASIGVKDEEGCGTLGAIVGDGVSLYALSCDHVINALNFKKEIVHPGLNDHLNYLRYHLSEYAKWIGRMTDNQETKISGAENLQKLEMQEKFNRLTELKEANQSSERCSQRILEGAQKHEKAFREGFKEEPRVVSIYTGGLRSNVEWTNGKEYFIDAAIAKLTEAEVKELRDCKTVELIETGDRPNGECCPVKDILSAEDLCKSGRTTGYTENGRVVGASVDAPTFMAPPLFEKQPGALFDVRILDAICPECVQRQTSQSQMEPVQGIKVRCKACNKETSNAAYERRTWRKNCLCIDGRNQFVDQGIRER